LFTPNQEIHKLLKDAEPKILQYISELEAVIAELEAKIVTFEENKVVADSRIANFEENIKALLSKHVGKNSLTNEFDWASAIAAAQGKVIRPEIPDEDEF
jgi:vacuolar-type H+-ATPase subunit I/STV1